MEEPWNSWTFNYKIQMLPCWKEKLRAVCTVFPLTVHSALKHTHTLMQIYIAGKGRFTLTTLLQCMYSASSDHLVSCACKCFDCLLMVRLLCCTHVASSLAWPEVRRRWRGEVWLPHRLGRALQKESNGGNSGHCSSAQTGASKYVKYLFVTVCKGSVFWL